MSSSVDPLVGSMLADRYRVNRLLGEGGMGKVYAAEHVLMKKPLALKVLHRELCSVPEVVARFEREAMATANIDHPNVAAATDFGRLPDGSLYLVLELVLGKSLRDEIATGALPLERALHIARQIAAALGAAHALDVVHRDLKPENVMLITRGDDTDFVKVLDFGIAKMPAAAQGPLTKLGVVFGTPEYMPPEQALGQSVDGRADLYALGVILYEMLSSVRPFTGQGESGILAQQLAKPVPKFSERVPGLVIPPRVELVVTKLLAKEVAARFQNAVEVVQVLDELLRPTPGIGGRMFTVANGSPTAFLGTASNVYGPAAVPRRAPLPPIASPPAPKPVAAPAPVAAAVPAPLVAEPEGRVAVPDLEPPPAAGPLGTLPIPEEPRAAEPPRARGPGRLRRIYAGTRVALALVCDFIDAHRDRLPKRIRSTLRRVPAAALLTFALVVVWGGTLLGNGFLAAARSKHKPAVPAQVGSAPPKQPAEDPVLREIADAKAKGHDALEKLAEAHPKSAPVFVELASSYASRGDYSAATTAIGKALALDPKVSEQQPVADVLATAMRKRDSANAASVLLTGSMGAAGARVLYDLSLDQKAPATLRQRAELWVRSPAFEKAASAEVQVAGALRYGKSCSARHDLLQRAGEVGGKRALAYLKIMRSRGGCGRKGRDDCFPCMRKDDALAKAISAVEKRLADKPDTY